MPTPPWREGGRTTTRPEAGDPKPPDAIAGFCTLQTVDNSAGAPMPRITVVTVRARIAAVALGAAVMLSLAGCTTPPPTPTPTPAFASDEEAFAAAEATYRAYVDALNEVDLGDPETFEAVYDLTTGDLNASDRKSYSTWHADGYTKIGAASIASIDAQTIDLSPVARVVANTCLDISSVDVLDSTGASVVARDRPPVQALQVTFVSGSSPTALLIASLDPATDGDQC